MKSHVYSNHVYSNHVFTSPDYATHMTIIIVIIIIIASMIITVHSINIMMMMMVIIICILLLLLLCLLSWWWWWLWLSLWLGATPCNGRLGTTANLRTMILDSRGFDSNILLTLRGGIRMYIGNLPKVLSRRILVWIINLSREIGRTTQRRS